MSSHRSSERDFDCLLGSWDIVNRWLDPDGTWHAFPSTARITSHVGGVVLTDEYDIPDFPTRGHVTALNIRSFDVVDRTWSLIWLASYCRADLRPVVGAWTSPDEGEFHQTLPGPDGGRMRLRFRYWKLSADAVRWEQALSFDDGAGWAPNWTMSFSRAG